MLNKIIKNLLQDDIFDIIFWSFILYFYFLNSFLYIFIVDILILIKILIIKRQKIFKIDKKYFIIFFLFFIISSLLIFFYKIKLNPFLFSSLILMLLLFSLAEIKFENLTIPLLFLPFISTIYYFIAHQQEAAFIYKHSSILGFLLLLGFILFRENKIMNFIYIVSIFFTFSKTSYILMFGLMIIFFVKHYLSLNKKKNIGFIIIFTFIIILLGISFSNSIKNDPFVSGRLTIWRTAFNTAINNLPFGVGGFNFNYYSDKYKPIKITNINEELYFYKNFLNDRIKLDVYNTKRVRYEHNIFLKFFVEYGIIGILFIFFLLFLIIVNLKYYSFPQKMLLAVFLFFSLIHNFSLTYFFLLPFIAIIFEKNRYKESDNFYFDRKIVIFAFILYLLIFSFPFFLNQYLSVKNISYTKKTFPFDIRYNYYIFQRKFNIYKKERNIKALLSLEREGERITAYNSRIKEIYSTLAFAFVDSYYSTNNVFFRKKALIYLKKLLEIEPSNPFALRELSEINFRAGFLNKSKNYIFKALRIEPFYISGLKTLKKIYTIENKKKVVNIINETLNKIVNDKKQYHFKGTSSYERYILDEK